MFRVISQLVRYPEFIGLNLQRRCPSGSFGSKLFATGIRAFRLTGVWGPEAGGFVKINQKLLALPCHLFVRVYFSLHLTATHLWPEAPCQNYGPLVRLPPCANLCVLGSFLQIRQRQGDAWMVGGCFNEL